MHNKWQKLWNSRGILSSPHLKLTAYIIMLHCVKFSSKQIGISDYIHLIGSAWYLSLTTLSSNITTTVYAELFSLESSKAFCGNVLNCHKFKRWQNRLEKLEIWGKAQRESARRPKSDWGKLQKGSLSSTPFRLCRYLHRFQRYLRSNSKVVVSRTDFWSFLSSQILRGRCPQNLCLR